LGLVADPGGEEPAESFVAAMPAEVRARKLKEIGVFLPFEQLEQLNLELQAIAERNLRAMKSSDQVEEELAAKFSKKELKELRKLGFSNDDLLTIDINEAKPFKDHKLGHIAHVDQLMVKQKEFLDKLNELFKKEQFEEKRKDDLMVGVMADDSASKKNEKWYFLEDPTDMNEWPTKKKQDYER
jgi:hydrogenase maturation factor HypF (carbamoyltransferase family)